MLEYYAGIQEAWDGPALLTFCDGKQIGAQRHRNPHPHPTPSPSPSLTPTPTPNQARSSTAMGCAPRACCSPTTACSP